MARSYGYFSGETHRIKQAIAMYQFMSGSTFTYYGEEIGMQGSGEKDVNFRAGMYWSKKDTKEQPTSPIGCELTNEDMRLGSVEEQKKDVKSILNYTKRILQIKNENPEIARGTVEKITVDDPDIVAYKKTYNNESVIIVMNTANYPKQFKFPKSNGYSKIRGYATVDDTQVTLKGEELIMSDCAVVVLK